MRDGLNRPLLAAACLVLLVAGAARAEVVFEEGIEYANPDGQHLKLNLPGRRKCRRARDFRRWCASTAGGFAPATGPGGTSGARSSPTAATSP